MTLPPQSLQVYHLASFASTRLPGRLAATPEWVLLDAMAMGEFPQYSRLDIVF